MARTYAALLRGVNVGGRNKVAMADLRTVFAAEGYGSVSTYIQSGNVIFSARKEVGDGSGGLESDIEAMLLRHLGLSVIVVVRAEADLRRVVERAPDGFGSRPDTYHSDVVFLKSPLSGEEAMRVVVLREGVDRAWIGDGVLYFQRLSALRTRSRLSALMGTPEYRRMTIRSWSTTTRLLTLLDEADPEPR